MCILAYIRFPRRLHKFIGDVKITLECSLLAASDSNTSPNLWFERCPIQSQVQVYSSSMTVEAQRQSVAEYETHFQ